VILLDTHVLLWALGRPDRIGPQGQRLIGRTDVRFVSAISHAEVAIKVARKNLRAPANMADLVTSSGFTDLPFEARHASGLGRFPGLERHDPFDRLLVAQAGIDELTLLTADRKLLALGQRWIIDATR
jgi:PIN domain nuclease of toxin-antitoxin system